MSLILYGAPLSPFVRKVEVLLREKGAEFESEPVNIMPMPDWFKEISPAKRIPVLRDLSVAQEGPEWSIAREFRRVSYSAIPVIEAGGG